MIQLIVGLGNPGNKHEGDRHNAGFWFVSALAKQHKQTLVSEKRFQGQIAKIKIASHELWLLQPETFMNLSGESVAAVCRFRKIPPQEVLVIHDELDLKPGIARLKQGGGTGGHNGLKDIQAQLGNPQFWRLRLGIGHPRDIELVKNGEKPVMDVADFVLKRPTTSEEEKIHRAIERSIAILPKLVLGDAQNAMQELHQEE